MDRKPKAESTKKHKAKAKEKEKPQRERFIEAARSIGADETGGEFEAALKRIMTRKKG